jgi:tetratricopeptide (TPR) repeat protein
MTQNNLGIAYSNRIRGERADNLEQAITAYERALEVRTREAFPEDWAMTQNSLAIAYRNRIRGEHADNLEQAISAYKQALEVRTREAFPEDWAMTQNNLAIAYSNRIRGERADNLEQAISAYKQALEVYTREAFPEQWAMTQNNLANAYRNRIRGERADNLEQASATFKRVLEVFTREAFPEQWAMTQNNLGLAYSNRIRGERADNLEQAIAAYERALEVYTCKAFPEDWAMTQNNLAAAYVERDQDGDLDRTITVLQEGLTVLKYKSELFINSQYALGQALTQRYERDQNPADLTTAEHAYNLALECIDPKHYDIEKYRNALPSLQALMGNRLVRDGRWKEGLQILLESLAKLEQANDPQAHANALYQTALAYEHEDNLNKARIYYRDALRLYTTLDDALGQAQSHAGLGNVLINQGFPEKGKRELETARELYQTLNKQDKLEAIDRRIASVCRTLDRLNALDIETSIDTPENTP